MKSLPPELPLSSRSALWSAIMVFACIMGVWSYAGAAEHPELPLRTKYQELNKALLGNPLQRPLVLDSTESSSDLKGEIHAVVDYPFADVHAALDRPEHWCDVLILHLNIKYCHAASDKAGSVLSVALGKKEFQPVADAYRAEFNFREVMSTPEYFALSLKAEHGPLGTHDFDILVEATAINDKQTFLHFTYAYGFGLASRLAMQTYLATLGRDKVGFTVTGEASERDSPHYIKGVRGLVERNTMRYFLAIDAYLASLTEPAERQLQHRLETWFKSTEQYPRQLHELEREEYLQMKLQEVKRQQSVP